MGNELESARSKLGDKAFETYIVILKRTTDKLMMKRKIDIICSGKEKIRRKEMDVYKNSSAGNLKARIRPHKNPEFWENKGPIPAENEDCTDVDFSGPIMESNPKKWTTGQILAAQKFILDFERDFFKKKGVHVETKTIEELRKTNVWLSFSNSVAGVMNSIFKDASHKMLGDEALLYLKNSAGKVVGRIQPRKDLVLPAEPTVEKPSLVDTKPSDTPSGDEPPLLTGQ